MNLKLLRGKFDLYHVGYMEGKPWPTASHEGPLLSCSSCPDEWRQIARLGEAPIWEIAKKTHIVLVDYHELSDKTCKTLMEEAVAKGLVQPMPVYRVCTSVDEDGEEWFTECESLKEAREAAMEGYQPKTIPGFKALGPLQSYWHGPGQKIDLLSVQVAAITWLIQQRGVADGILWNDLFDPDSLSAPRVGIFPDRILRADHARERITLKPN